ncbi:hypothetical protein [Mucilaginibacter endophyticus]|uniref:hypothetical protein n=1 Tax=Mucilaginibacter endophyticus TaxID=2675003 RepID=UPI000E0DA6C5|nr:hypothetical protein [Mucilaginibacter endophyticus]
MRRNYTKNLLLSGLALAGLAGAGQVASAHSQSAASTVEYKATNERKAKKSKIAVNDVTGGLDFAPMLPKLGMSPKEYGLRYGSGGTKRSNRLRYSHNAKVKRRKV